MKLVRPLLLFFSLSLFAMQVGEFRGFGRSRYDYYGGPAVPSEFYWSRLQYTSTPEAAAGFVSSAAVGLAIILRPITIA